MNETPPPKGYIYDDKRSYKAAVMDYLRNHPHLEVWSSVGAADLLKKKLVKGTRKGLTLTAAGRIRIRN